MLVCRSEKEQAAPTFKHTFGYHPLLPFCDNTGEFLAALLIPGTPVPTPPPITSQSWTPALEQVPDAYRHGHPILVRADDAGCTKAFLAPAVVPATYRCCGRQAATVRSPLSSTVRRWSRPSSSLSLSL